MNPFQITIEITQKTEKGFLPKFSVGGDVIPIDAIQAMKQLILIIEDQVSKAAVVKGHNGDYTPELDHFLDTATFGEIMTLLNTPNAN